MGKYKDSSVEAMLRIFPAIDCVTLTHEPVMQVPLLGVGKVVEDPKGAQERRWWSYGAGDPRRSSRKYQSPESVYNLPQWHGMTFLGHPGAAWGACCGYDGRLSENMLKLLEPRV